MYPPPTAFGMPSQFKSWRPDQVKAFQLILDSDTRFIGLNMPTGSGKSLTYMTALNLLPEGCRGVALTATKGLQDQVATDYLELGIVDVRGQSNYPCRAMQAGGEHQHLRGLAANDPTCQDGPCHAGSSCTLREAGCLYYDKVREARESKITQTNYALWIAQRMYGQGLGEAPDILVLDEAHQAVDELASALTIEVPKYLLTAVQIPVAVGVVGIPGWRAWATHQLRGLTVLLESYGAPKSAADSKHKAKLIRAHRLLFRMSQMSAAGEWIEDHDDSALRFECLRPQYYAEQILFQGARKVVFASATLTPKTLAMLGVTGDTTYWECPSSFPPERRPVYHIPTVQVGHGMSPAHITAWIRRLDQILDQRPGVKGIIHTVSYKRQQQILALSAHASRMLTHGNKPGETAKVVARFKAMPGSPILVSPSVMTGWDFPADLCRLQVICKLPFPDTRSKIVQARSELDKDYGPYYTMQSMVQAVGRGMRSAGDWCETFVIDDHFKWFIYKHRKLAPQWFLDAVKTTATLPKPLTLKG